MLLTSCGDWLNIQPKSEVTSENLYNNADGYRSALVGLYLGMSEESLYGSNMTLTQMEYLANSIRAYYMPDPGAVPTLYQLNNFIIHLGERNNLIENVFSNIWSKAYGVVANCNYFLRQLENQDAGLFEPGVKEVMLGEAYAIRAYLHFDMMRLFHYPYGDPNGKTAKCVPYVTEFGLALSESLTSDQIMDKALEDLEKAESLMKETDPAITGKQYFDRYFGRNRQFKMNYFAVRALMARIYLQKQEYGKAFEHSTFVLDNASRMSARMANATDLEAKDANFSGLPYNRSFPMENIFAVYSEKLDNVVNGSFSNTAPTAGRLQLNRSFVTDYCNDPRDIRRSAWAYPLTGSRNYLMKFVRPTLEGEINKYPLPAIPLIKLGEMYLIAAESALNDQASGGIAEAVSIMNEFRSNRGVDQLAGQTAETLSSEIKKQYYTEFIGEGQIFFFYKRINSPNIPNVLAKEFAQPLDKPMTVKNYTPDIPMAEVVGGRQPIN